MVEAVAPGPAEVAKAACRAALEVSPIAVMVVSHLKASVEEEA